MRIFCCSIRFKVRCQNRRGAVRDANAFVKRIETEPVVARFSTRFRPHAAPVAQLDGGSIVHYPANPNELSSSLSSLARRPPAWLFPSEVRRRSFFARAKRCKYHAPGEEEISGTADEIFSRRRRREQPAIANRRSKFTSASSRRYPRSNHAAEATYRAGQADGDRTAT